MISANFSHLQLKQESLQLKTKEFFQQIFNFKHDFLFLFFHFTSMHTVDNFSLDKPNSLIDDKRSIIINDLSLTVDKFLKKQQIVEICTHLHFSSLILA